MLLEIDSGKSGLISVWSRNLSKSWFLETLLDISGKKSEGSAASRTQWHEWVLQCIDKNWINRLILDTNPSKNDPDIQNSTDSNFCDGFFFFF